MTPKKGRKAGAKFPLVRMQTYPARPAAPFPGLLFFGIMTGCGSVVVYVFVLTQPLKGFYFSRNLCFHMVKYGKLNPNPEKTNFSNKS